MAGARLKVSPKSLQIYRKNWSLIRARWGHCVQAYEEFYYCILDSSRSQEGKVKLVENRSAIFNFSRIVVLSMRSSSARVVAQ